MELVENHNDYERIEGLGNFLINLDPILCECEVGEFEVNLFRSDKGSLHDLYIRVQESSVNPSSFYHEPATFLVSGLENMFVVKVELDEDFLEVYLQHHRKGNPITSKITVTKDGQVVVSKKLELSTYEGPFVNVLATLELNHNIICFHPLYADYVVEFEEEFEKSDDLEYGCDCEIGGVQPHAFPYVMQKLRTEFESKEQVWVLSGTLSHKNFIRFVGGLEYHVYQYFIALRIKGQLHFHLTSKMRSIHLSGRSWADGVNGSVELSCKAYDIRQEYERGPLKVLSFSLSDQGIEVVSEA